MMRVREMEDENLRARYSLSPHHFSSFSSPSFPTSLHFFALISAASSGRKRENEKQKNSQIER